MINFGGLYKMFGGGGNEVGYTDAPPNAVAANPMDAGRLAERHRSQPGIRTIQMRTIPYARGVLYREPADGMRNTYHRAEADVAGPELRARTRRALTMLPHDLSKGRTIGAPQFRPEQGAIRVNHPFQRRVMQRTRATDE